MSNYRLDAIGNDMRNLYDKLLSGEIELKTAAELANIAGKNLKVEQLKLAGEIFAESVKPRGLPASAAMPAIEGECRND